MVSIRQSTFQKFDGLRDMFQQCIQSIKKETVTKLIVETHPEKPTWFQVHCHPLTLQVEIKKEGIIYLSFGTPKKQDKALYNWILKGMNSLDTDDVKWYLYNMKDQVGPDFIVNDWLNVMKFFMKELMFNQDMYLNPPLILPSNRHSTHIQLDGS